MKLDNKAKKINENVLRLGDELDYVDVVSTSRGNVRIGSMPDIAKFMGINKVKDNYVVFQEPRVTQLGDNKTSEEFVMWNAMLIDNIKRNYVGAEDKLKKWRDILGITNNYLFTEDRSKIVEIDKLNDYFVLSPTKNGSFADGDLRVEMNGNIKVFDKGNLVYDYNSLRPTVDINAEVDKAVNAVQHDTKFRDQLEVLALGTGNGFGGESSSFIIMYGDRKIWVDPSSRPHETLAQVNINWDDITDYLITHNHADHVQGFPAALQRHVVKGKKMSVLTPKVVYDTLKAQFGDLFNDMDDYIKLTELGKKLSYNGADFEFRNNHHLLPTGTIGFKLNYNGRTLGFSGDTKFKKEINQTLDNPQLSEEWFRGCNLVLHEIDFDKPNSLHTYYKDLKPIEDLVKAEGGKVLVYHAVSDNPPIPMMKEGKVYGV